MVSLEVIIKQMILSAFRSAKMTSASPGHINYFIGLESQGGMDIIGSNEEIQAAIREAVQGITDDPQGADELSQNLLNSENKTGKGKLEGRALSTVSTITGTAQNPVNVVAGVLPFLPHAALVTLAILLAPLMFATILDIACNINPLNTANIPIIINNIIKSVGPKGK